MIRKVTDCTNMKSKETEEREWVRGGGGGTNQLKGRECGPKASFLSLTNNDKLLREKYLQLSQNQTSRRAQTQLTRAITNTDDHKTLPKKQPQQSMLQKKQETQRNSDKPIVTTRRTSRTHVRKTCNNQNLVVKQTDANYNKERRNKKCNNDRNKQNKGIQSNNRNKLLGHSTRRHTEAHHE